MTETTPIAIGTEILIDGINWAIVDDVINEDDGTQTICAIDQDGGDHILYGSGFDVLRAPEPKVFDSGKAFAAILDRLDKTVESARAFKL